jgi:signal peptidase
VIDPPRETPAARTAGNRRSFGALVTLPLAVLVIAVVLPFTTFVVASWLLGWQLQPVLTASMSPTYPVGSLLVVGPVDPSEVRAGMAVTFDDPAKPGRLVTHRVVRVREGDPLFFDTQGDANASPDPFPVPARSIRGRVLWHVPILGYAVDFLGWPRGFILLVVIPAVALGLTEALALRRRRRRVAAARASP